MDGPQPGPLAGARLHGARVHRVLDMPTRLEQPDGPQVLCILYVMPSGTSRR